MDNVKIISWLTM